MIFDFIKRFDLLAHINEECLDSKDGFRANLFQNKENQEFILAIVGSDLRPLKFDIGDLISDFILLNGKIPKKQFNSLLKFYMLIKKRILLSLGGYLA